MLLTVREWYRVIFENVCTICGRLDTFSQKNEQALFWGFGILYKFVLDALYIFAAKNMYAYAGLVYEPNFVKYIIATGMYMVFFACIPKREHDCAVFLLHLQFAYTIAPMFSFYALSNASSRYILMVFLCGMLEIFLVVRPHKEPTPVYITGVSSYATVMVGVLLTAALTIPVLYNGFHGLKVFDFNYIYQMRANATYPKGFSYLFFWMGKTIVPFFIIYFLYRKQYVKAVAALFIQVLLYMECGNKYLLFIAVPIIAIYLCAKTGHLLKLMYAGLILLFLVVILAYQMDIVTNNPIGIRTSFLVSVRAIFHPADNKFGMYECFSQYPKLLFSDGQIGHMLGLTNLYKLPYGQIVCAFLKKGTTNLNTGYLGEAYAQLGFVGMLVMSVMFSYILRWISSYNSKKTFAFLTALFSMYIINLNDISLLTTLFSSGMLIVLMLIAIYLTNETEAHRHGIQRS